MNAEILRKTALLLAVLTLVLAVCSACGPEGNVSGEDVSSGMEGSDPAVESGSDTESRQTSEGTESSPEQSDVSSGESSEPEWSDEPSVTPSDEPSVAPSDRPDDGSSDVSDGSDSEEPDTNSDDPSGDISEDPIEPPEPVFEATAVSIGCHYTTSGGVIGAQYPDNNGAELTDGLRAPETCSYYEGRLVGFSFSTGSSVALTVDLGKVYETIHRFELGYLSCHDAGVGPVSAVKVEISTDGKSWKSLGNCKIPPYLDLRMQNATLELDAYVSARYVRFTAVKTQYWLFFDELSVIADVESGGVGTKWGSTVLNTYRGDGNTDAGKDAVLKQVTTGTPKQNLEHIDIAFGVGYSFTSAVSSAYPDDGKKLTDGIVGKTPSDNCFVGFEGGKEVGIDVNLKSVVNDVSGFSIRAFCSRSLGVQLPPAVTVLVSDDGKTWTEVGRAYAPMVEQEYHTFSIELPVTVRAKYVRFRLTASECRLYLIDEVSVYAFRSDKPSVSIYPTVKFPKVSSDVYWSSSESDYVATKNLLKGLPQQIRAVGNMEVPDDGNNSPADSKVLTDGIYATGNNIHNGSFFKINGYSGREIFYDLGKVSTVRTFKMGFTYLPEWGVYSPATVQVVASMNGVEWYKLGQIVPKTGTGPSIVRAELSLSTAVAARFIGFVVPVGSWVGIDEIEVIGTKRVAGGTKTVSTAGLARYYFEGDAGSDWAGPSADILGGVHDIFLAYHKSSKGRTYDDLLAEVAYLDRNGNIKDTMFDGFLFLMSGGFPSGQGGGTGGVLIYNKDDAEWLIRSLFGDGQNIMALERAAGDVKKALGLPSSYKVKYYVSLYYPKCDNFGDIDGDGKSEDLSTIAGKTKVLKWWINKFEAERAKHNFKNVEFGGYYWYNESLSSEQIPMTTAVRDLIHSYKSQFFWIPYFSAGGVGTWANYGFDVACLQPNYAFNLAVPDSRVPVAAQLAKTLGMCVEIEMSDAAGGDARYRMKYYEYLKQGAKMGYMTKATHMYYMGMYIHQFATASDPQVRQIYDYTYQFIKGKLNVKPASLAGKKFAAAKETVLTGTLLPNDGTLVLRIFESPKHGTVTINEDGTFAYYPNKGFTGADSFSFVYSERLDESDPCKVEITVK